MKIEMENKKVVHIALIGEQTMPVYLAIKYSKAEKFIFIHSDQTKKRAEPLSKYVSKDGRSAELIKLDSVDFNAAKLQMEEAIKKYDGWVIEANISSGTKPWTIALAVLSESYSNVELIYVDQNSRIFNYKTSEVRDVEPLTINEILEYNQSIPEKDGRNANRLRYKHLDDYTEEDYGLIPEIKGIRQKYNRGKQSLFNDLTIPDKNRRNKVKFANNVKDTYVDPETSSEISWNKHYVTENGEIKQYVRLFFIGYAGHHEEFELISPHAFDLVTSSGWFEYELAKILEAWPSCKDVWMNVVFPYRDEKAKNEIDVIVGNGRKLLFVECKTQVQDNTDIDKFASAVKNYGGMGAKAIFITQSKMGSKPEEKCETNKIAHFSFDAGQPKQKSRKDLYDVLDDLMKESNTR
jgi:hypothetical protein